MIVNKVQGVLSTTSSIKAKKRKLSSRGFAGKDGGESGEMEDCTTKMVNGERLGPIQVIGGLPCLVRAAIAPSLHLSESFAAALFDIPRTSPTALPASDCFTSDSRLRCSAAAVREVRLRMR